MPAVDRGDRGGCAAVLHLAVAAAAEPPGGARDGGVPGWGAAVTAEDRVYCGTVGNHRWSSDGACVIREDAPLPRLDRLAVRLELGACAWLSGEDMKSATADRVVEWVEAVPATPDPEAMVHGRFVPVLRFGDRIDQIRIPEWPVSRVIRVWRAGEVVAFIAPLVRGRSRGRAVPLGPYLESAAVTP